MRQVAEIQSRYERDYQWRQSYQGSPWLPWPVPGREYVAAERCDEGVRVFVETRDGTWVWQGEQVTLPTQEAATEFAAQLATSRGLPVRWHMGGLA